MLFLHPRQVTFGGVAWTNVASVAVERTAAREFVEHAGEGPHPVLADVPEQRVRVAVAQELPADDVDVPRPGRQGVLEFETAPNASGAGRKRVAMTAVVLNVKYQLSRRAGSARAIDLIAVSPDGLTDPVTVEPL